jgi:hypothetical protein
MSTPFDGNWTDPYNTQITITSSFDVLSIQYSSKPNPQAGFYLPLGAGVATVNFDQARAAVLIEGGKSLRWDNDTVWTKA